MHSKTRMCICALEVCILLGVLQVDVLLVHNFILMKVADCFSRLWYQDLTS